MTIELPLAVTLNFGSSPTRSARSRAIFDLQLLKQVNEIELFVPEPLPL